MMYKRVQLSKYIIPLKILEQISKRKIILNKYTEVDPKNWTVA